MHTLDERVHAVRKREYQTRARRYHLVTWSLSVAGATSFALLALLLGTFNPTVSSPDEIGQNLYGASLFGDSAGGYVLVAILSFVAAVTLTVVCLRRRNQQSLRDSQASKPEPTTMEHENTTEMR